MSAFERTLKYHLVLYRLFLEGRKDFFPLFLLATAKSALSMLTVKCRVLLTSLSSEIRNLTAS